MSPFLAVSVLNVWLNKKSGLQLQRRQYDEAVDSLVAMLEKANDEQYRLVDEAHKEIQDVQE